MLIIKPNCELCDKDLPANSTDACICSYECTFCASCVATRLRNVCPNCGGGFTQRPIRPSTEYRPGVSLQQHPASQERVYTLYSATQIENFAKPIATLPPQQR